MKKFSLFLLFYFLISIGCNRVQPKLTIEPISQKERPDGFVDDCSRITAVKPPPPMPFRFQGGNRISLNWVNVANTGRESDLKVVFNVSMGRVGDIRFQGGSAVGVMATSSRIENALNTWHFTNNGWGEITMKLNFGSKKVLVDFSEFNLHDGVDIQESTFYFCFAARSGDLSFQL